MSLYLVIQSINYPVGEAKLDREYVISTQGILPRKERTDQVQHRKNHLLLPYQYDHDSLIGRPHASISPYSGTSALYTALFDPDEGEDDKERPTAIVSEKRFWHALPFLKPKSREVRLQRNVPFEMRLEDQCMIGVGGTYTLCLSPSPVFEAFRARIRATSYDK